MPAQDGQIEAEKLYRQMEMKIRSGKTVKLRIDAVMLFADTKISKKDTLILGEGDNLRLDSYVKSDNLESKSIWLSDGAKVFVKDSKNPVEETKAKAKNLGTYFRGVLPRTGLNLQFVHLSPWNIPDEGKKINDAFFDEVFKVSDFKLGVKVKVGNVETRVVEYLLTISQQPASAKVWINTQTNLPVKLVVRTAVTVAGKVDVTEEYSDFVLDGKVDEKLFEAPK